jgi:putative resolvase
MEKDLPEYLTLTQACELLQVHPNTLRNWDKNGTLKAIRIGAGKLRRYKKEEILTLLEKNDGTES